MNSYRPVLTLRTQTCLYLVLSRALCGDHMRLPTHPQSFIQTILGRPQVASAV